MEARIGHRTVAALKPQEKPYQLHDTDIHGFLIRVQPSGVMTYYYEYRLVNGLRNRIRIEKHGKVTPEQARDRVKLIAADLVRGVDPKASKKQARVPALRQYVDEIYKPWAEAHLKSGAVSVKRIKSRFAHILDRALDDPKLPWLLEKWKTDRLKEQVSKLTINRDLTVLKGAFSYAVKQKEQTLLAQNPLSAVKLFKVNDEETERVRYLNQNDSDEEQRLLHAINVREERIRQGRENGNQWRSVRGYELYPSLSELIFVNCLKPMVEISLHTGVRRGELFRLRWPDINWDLSCPVLTVRGSISKNGRMRSIPLNTHAVEVLRAWALNCPDQNGLIFSGKDGKPFNTLKTAWGSIVEEAKLVDFRWHDLRHTFASRLVMSGVDLNTVRDLLGHKDIKMTLRYAHLSPAVKAEAVARLVDPAKQAVRSLPMKPVSSAAWFLFLRGCKIRAWERHYENVALFLPVVMVATLLFLGAIEPHAPVQTATAKLLKISSEWEDPSKKAFRGFCLFWYGNIPLIGDWLDRLLASQYLFARFYWTTVFAVGGVAPMAFWVIQLSDRFRLEERKRWKIQFSHSECESRISGLSERLHRQRDELLEEIEKRDKEIAKLETRAKYQTVGKMIEIAANGEKLELDYL